MAQAWDCTTDSLVVGSGGGGMVAALAASDLECKTIIEKGSVYGGSTAMSGGAMWMPNNHSLFCVHMVMKYSPACE